MGCSVYNSFITHLWYKNMNNVGILLFNARYFKAFKIVL